MPKNSLLNNYDDWGYSAKEFRKDFKGKKRKRPKLRKFKYNPKDSWNKNRKAYMKSKEWDYIRKKVLVRDKYRCRFCHRRSRSMQVHHITYERLFAEDLNDLITLCGYCHAKHHGKI